MMLPCGRVNGRPTDDIQEAKLGCRNPSNSIPSVVVSSAAERKRSPPDRSDSAPGTISVNRGVQFSTGVGYCPPAIAARLALATSMGGCTLQVPLVSQRETVRVLACFAINDASSRALGAQSALGTTGSEVT